MFGAPLRDFCLRDVEEKPVVEGFVVKEPFTEEPAPEESVTEESVTEESVPEESVAEESVAEESVAEESVTEESVAEEPSTDDVLKQACAKVGYVPAEKTQTVEEFSNCHSHNKEGFSNRVLFGQRFLSLDLALRAVLYALLFYIVAHNDTQGLLKGVVKRLPKVVKPFAPMLLFGVLYYVLNLFI